MTTSRRLGLAALVLATVMTLAGCGSQDPTADPTSDGSKDGQPTASASGGSVPSDWQVAKIDAAQLYLPPKWSILSSTANAVSFAVAPDANGSLPGSATMTANVHSSVGDVKANVDDAAEFHLETFRGDSNLKNVERLSDVEINGVPFAHIQWEKETSWDSEYITVTPDGETVVTVGWGLSKSDLDREGSQELIDPVMATFELT